jgi:hypothetical protein
MELVERSCADRWLHYLPSTIGVSNSAWPSYLQRSSWLVATEHIVKGCSQAVTSRAVTGVPCRTTQLGRDLQLGLSCSGQQRIIAVLLHDVDRLSCNILNNFLFALASSS